MAATANEQAARSTAALIDTNSPTQRQNLVDDLATAAGGGALNAKRVTQLQAAGLLDEQGNVSNVGASLLPQEALAPIPPQPAWQDWQSQQQAVLASNPRVAVPSSPENVAFVRAFRASGGDARAVLAAMMGGESRLRDGAKRSA